MNYVLVVPQPRGQITLPKRLRDKFGIRPGVPVRVTDERGGITIRSMVGDGQTILPRISREEYAKRLEEFEKSKMVLWTKEDDKHMKLLRKKDGERAKLLDW